MLSVEVTDTPQWAPCVISDPEKGNSGSLSVTINKFNAIKSLSKASDSLPAVGLIRVTN
jgi:hypothetical protein